MIATNPLGALVAWYNVEYTRKITTKTAVELSAATIRFPGRASRMTIGARYYPRAVFAGPFVGVKAGPVHAHQDRNAGYERSNMLALAAEAGFERLAGDRENRYVSMGAGFTRLAGGDTTHTPYAGKRTYFTFRMKFGLAF